MKTRSGSMNRNARAFGKALALPCVCAALMPLQTLAVSSINVGGGTLHVGTLLHVSEIVVGSGAVLGGDGRIYAHVTVEGSITPSAKVPSPAFLTIYGSVTFVSGSSFHCHAASHTQCDELVVNGTLDGSCEIVPTKASGAVPVNAKIFGRKFGTYSGFSLAQVDEQDWRIEIDGTSLLLTDLVGDSDSNTLPDWYELEYFLVRTGTDPGGHGDDDGLTNWEELIAGTDPTDGSSSFIVGPIVRYPPVDDGDQLGFYIEWPSVSDRHYTLYYGIDVDTRINLMQSVDAYPPTNIFYFKTALDTLFVHGAVERSP